MSGLCGLRCAAHLPLVGPKNPVGTSITHRSSPENECCFAARNPPASSMGQLDHWHFEAIASTAIKRPSKRPPLAANCALCRHRSKPCGNAVIRKQLENSKQTPATIQPNAVEQLHFNLKAPCCRHFPVHGGFIPPHQQRIFAWTVGKWVNRKQVRSLHPQCGCPLSMWGYAGHNIVSVFSI